MTPSLKGVAPGWAFPPLRLASVAYPSNKSRAAEPVPVRLTTNGVSPMLLLVILRVAARPPAAEAGQAARTRPATASSFAMRATRPTA